MTLSGYLKRFFFGWFGSDDENHVGIRCEAMQAFWQWKIVYCFGMDILSKGPIRDVDQNTVSSLSTLQKQRNRGETTSLGSYKIKRRVFFNLLWEAAAS